jgi:hypothetical protein
VTIDEVWPEKEVRMNRQELYDLIWSEPVKEIAPRFGISDVALSKLCQKHEIPQPPRGHWAKVAAGKKVARVPLPPRGLGIRDIVRPGRHDHWAYYETPNDLLKLDLGQAPTFAEPVEDMIERVRRMVGKISVPRDLSRAHANIRTLLEQDDVRRAEYLSKSYRSAMYAPLFDSPFEKRRLRFMNALMFALARLGCKPTLSRKKDPNEIELKVGHQFLSITVDEPGYSRFSWRSEKDLTKSATSTLRVSLGVRTDAIQTEWQDKNDDRVENYVSEIVVAALAGGEIIYRQREVGHHERLVARKAQLIEEEKRAREERARKERERQEAERQARIDKLVGDAARHRQANDIRAYVSAVRTTIAVSREQLDRWTDWALKQADELDPLTTFQLEMDQSNDRATGAGGTTTAKTTPIGTGAVDFHRELTRH